VHEGTLVTTHDGQVITNVEVHGDIQVNHDNVTLHHFRMIGGHLLVNPENSGAVIEDCELDGGSDPGTFPAVSYARYELRRCEIHNFGEGPMANGDVIIENNVMHSFVDYFHLDAHQDAVQVVCNDNITIRQNWLDMNVETGNAAIMVGTACGSVDNVLIEGNVVLGGGFAIYPGRGCSAGDPNCENATNTRVIDNWVSTIRFPLGGYWGPFYSDADVMEGNRWLDGPNAGELIATG